MNDGFNKIGIPVAIVGVTADPLHIHGIRFRGLSPTTAASIKCGDPITVRILFIMGCDF
jgi:hypothetical protein